MNSTLEKTLFAVLFAVGDPISAEKLASAMDLTPSEIRAMLREISAWLEQNDFPVELQELDGQFQLSTRPRDTEIIRRVLNEKRNVPLTQAALEVLSAVAYNQPVTRAYIEQVRGIDSSGIVASLVEKGLLEEAGRLELPGRPIAYRTTATFLRTFGLSSLEDLPSVAEDSEALERELLGAENEDIMDGQISFEE